MPRGATNLRTRSNRSTRHSTGLPTEPRDAARHCRPIIANEEFSYSFYACQVNDVEQPTIAVYDRTGGRLVDTVEPADPNDMIEPTENADWIEPVEQNERIDVENSD